MRAHTRPAGVFSGGASRAGDAWGRGTRTHKILSHRDKGIGRGQLRTCHCGMRPLELFENVKCPTEAILSSPNLSRPRRTPTPTQSRSAPHTCLRMRRTPADTESTALPARKRCGSALGLATRPVRLSLVRCERCVWAGVSDGGEEVTPALSGDYTIEEAAIQLRVQWRLGYYERSSPTSQTPLAPTHRCSPGTSPRRMRNHCCRCRRRR